MSKLETAAYICAECGNEVEEIVGDGDLSVMMAAHNLCFLCAFWAEKVAIRDREDVVRANGEHYIITPTRPGMKAKHKAFRGERFTVHFADGRRVETDNLWHQGSIPAHFRDRLGDNATLERHGRYHAA